jgi:tRNA(adenine34) deaminase
MTQFEWDVHYMRRCIALSKASFERGDAAFGCIITRNNEVVVESGNNRNNRISDHAEVVALHAAHQILGTADLSDCTMFASCEPCPMCAFMVREYRIKRVVFGVTSHHMGGFTKWPIMQDTGLDALQPIFNHHPEVVPGFLEAEAREVMDNTPLKKYFAPL